MREEAPDVAEVEVAVAACRDCRDVIGPTHAGDVGLELHLLHDGHDAEVVGRWTETRVLEGYFEGDEG